MRCRRGGACDFQVIGDPPAGETMVMVCMRGGEVAFLLPMPTPPVLAPPVPELACQP